jgi:hypothetical protein
LNAKLKAENKRLADELAELRQTLDRVKGEAARFGETQSLLMVLRSRDEESKNLIA